MTSKLNTKFDELLEFPCEFPFKVLGLADEQLPDMVVAVLQEHAPGDYVPTVRPSSKGTYHAVSVLVTVHSKEQIETLYTALGEIELVKYVL
ncbi:MAG: YbeD family protein [Aeromonadales bacterium]|nr:YbeD family protein [Aeromonadales bacterium]